MAADPAEAAGALVDELADLELDEDLVHQATDRTQPQLPRRLQSRPGSARTEFNRVTRNPFARFQRRSRRKQTLMKSGRCGFQEAPWRTQKYRLRSFKKGVTEF